MMTVSKALTGGQAQHYYRQDYSNAESNYYSQRDTIKGEWTGQLAEEWGLKGEVTQEQYERLIDGQDPQTGELLTREVKPYAYTNRDGEQVMTKGRRAGWDATFSAPKSVSLAALVGGDERIRGAHRKAVDTALIEVEKYIQAKMGNTNPSVTTGRMVAAKFEHDTARPDKEFNYAAPQLHTHAVIFNLTQLLNGKYRALDSQELFGSQRYATAIYRAVLAIELQKLGYEIEVDAKTGAPEIKGFTKEYLQANSLRSKELRQEAAEMKARLEAEGNVVRDGAGLRQAAATANRRNKKFNREEMRERHQALDREHGGQARQAVETAHQRGKIEHSQEEIAKRAQEATTFGIARAMDSEAVGDARDLIAHSLRRNMGLTTYEAVMQEIAVRKQEGELIGILREEHMPEVTTRRMLDLERTNIREVLDGGGKQQPIIEAAQVGQVIDRISAEQGRILNDSQREAVEQLLTNRDRIFGLQGLAGTGKTTVLTVLRAAAEEAGYTVRGFAPSTPASKALSESGIETSTLQKFTFSKRETNEAEAGEGRRLFVLDESSLASTYQVHKFFDRINPEDRIWLVGDKGQHEAVEAGSPFGQFQMHGMGTAKIARIVRQKDEGLRQVVEKLAERKVKDAVRDLIAQGRVLEYADDKTRLRAMAADFCADREGTLVISPANEERVLLNAMIRGELQREEGIDAEDHRTMVLVNRADMTGTERRFAGAYDPGDIIRYNQSSGVYGTRAGDYGKVISHNREENTITVRLKDDREISYDPRRLSGVSVYREAERDFAIGDRIQFRAPYASERVANGEFGTITEITEKEWKVQLGDKRVVSFDPRTFRHLDHGYAVTSHSSQCATFRRVLINADTKESELLLNQRMGYVGISRAQLDARVYTDSIRKLSEALNRRVDKKMALEAVTQNRLNAAQHVANGGAINERQLRTPVALAGEEQQASHANGTFKKAVTEYQFPEWEKPAQQKLVRVRRKSPCPICNKPDWCSVSADRAIAICMRVPSEHEAKNGGYVHVLDGTTQSQEPRAITVEVTQHERASIGRRHKANRELLESLKLNSHDRKSLLARGLDEAAIERNGYKSVPSPLSVYDAESRFKGKDLTGIPGFYKVQETWKLNIGEWKSRDGQVHSFHQGFLIPVRDARGRIEGFQIRRSEVRNGDDPRYIWLSSSNKEHGCSSGAPIHYRNVEQARRSGQAVITEGALKADLTSHLLGNSHAVIAVAGVSSFQEDFGQRLKGQIPELRQVVIAFDADAVRNPPVQRALERLGESLRAAGLDVRELRWEERQGKGIDDYLLNDPARRDEVKKLLTESLASIKHGYDQAHERHQQGGLKREQQTGFGISL